MTPRPILSILTPAVPSRLHKLSELCEGIQSQIDELPGGELVEHLVLLDNKLRTVGEKRDALLRAARGEYVAFVDDDDWIAGQRKCPECGHLGIEPNPDSISGRGYCLSCGRIVLAPAVPEYVSELLQAAKHSPDVITFRQHATYNGLESEVHFGLGNPNEPFTPGGVTRRNAWHVCAWRRTLAIQSRFPASNYGEDWEFAAPLCALPNLREVHIPHVLHYYRHDARTTEAPEPQAYARPVLCEKEIEGFPGVRCNRIKGHGDPCDVTG